MLLFHIHNLIQDTSFLVFSPNEEGIDQLKKSLRMGKSSFPSLNKEWKENGEEAFAFGFLEESDELEESLDDWLEVFDNVEYLGILDQNTGE